MKFINSKYSMLIVISYMEKEVGENRRFRRFKGDRIFNRGVGKLEL